MGREIRRVPANWDHPTRYPERIDDRPNFRPLMDDYIGSLEYWKKDVDEFIAYMTEVIQTGQTMIYDNEYSSPIDVYEYLTDEDQLSPPDANDYMPSGDWYQLFETVSEGTPLSPPFEKPEELVEWLANNNDYCGHTWSREQAEAMVRVGFAPSGIFANGRFYNSQQSLELAKQN